MNASSLGLELKGLYDCARIVRELGVSRKVAEKIMRRCRKVQLDGVRKTYVYGAEIAALLEASTIDEKSNAPLGKVA